MIKDVIRRHITYIAKKDFIAGFYNAFFEAMSFDNIKFGFRAAGLVLFDPEHVIAKLEVPSFVLTPTISPLSSGSSLTLPAKTLRTTRKITRQLRYL